jgi:pimeloyl-ACP methyl ester carboxylesterase
MESTPINGSLIVREPARPQGLPPLFFLHGAWHGAWCWEPFMDFFSAAGFRCFALDLAGHGLAARPDDYDRRLVRDHLGTVKSALRSIDPPGRPFLIAHSMGGWLAQMLLADPEPVGVAGAVLVAPVPSNGVPVRTSLKIMVQHPLAFARPVLLRSMAITGTGMARRFFHGPDKSEREVEVSTARLRPEGGLACLDLILGLSRVNPARVRRIPTLVLAAGHDYLFPLASERRLARRLGAEILEFPGCAHNLMEDTRRREIAQAIHGWLLRMLPSQRGANGSSGA